MNIGNNTSVNFTSKYQKMIVPLKDNTKAILEFNKDLNSGYKCMIANNKNQVVGLRGHFGKNLSTEFAETLDYLRKNAKEGFDFLKEFINSMKA